MFPISLVAETTILAAEKPHQTSLKTTGRLDKLPETRHFYAKREFSGDLGA